MAPTTRKDRAYLVTRTDNHSGLSVRATNAAGALKRAQCWPWMRGAANYEVRPFFRTLKADGTLSDE